MSVTRLMNSPALRTAFAMAFLFGNNGVLMPFLPQWLADKRGLTAPQIGVVLCTAQVLRFLINPLIAAWADGFQDRRTPVRILAVTAICCFGVFYSVTGFPALLIVGFLTISCAISTTPLLEGAALRASRVGGEISFGITRGFASFSFVIIVTVTGWLIGLYGIGVTPIASFFLLACGIVSVFALKPDFAPQTGPALGYRARLREAGRLASRKRFALLLVAAGCIQGSHGFFYNFSSLAWKAQGIGPDTIGMLWAVSVVCEVIALSTMRYWERFFRPETLLLIGACACFTRWLGLSFAPPLALIVPLQMLHVGSFAAAHIGTLRIVERETPPHLAGLGMTLYAALGNGTPLGLATLASGYLYAQFGARGYLAMAVAAAIGVAISGYLFATRRGAFGDLMPVPGNNRG
jgi:PPP family 3-phenylpropionic acid transporter